MMAMGLTRLLSAAGVLGYLLASADSGVFAQLPHDRGQNIVPVFEGWQRNPDGTFALVFGSYNRNYKEIVDIPIGPENGFSPGPADRNQPARFYPRRQRFSFRVTVPPDFGTQELVWTLTSRGKTEKAYGTLSPVYEIDTGVLAEELRRGRGVVPPSVVETNKAPEVTALPVGTVKKGHPHTVSLMVTDDGLPAARNDGLEIEWTVHRGTGVVSLTPSGATRIDAGRASASVTFAEADTHMLRAVVFDGLLQTAVTFNVEVE